MKAVLKKISQVALLLPMVVMAISAVTPPSAAQAVPCTPNVNTQGISGGADCAAPTNASNNLFGTNGVFVTIVNILIFIVGAIAVLMLIIGGIRYVVSNGEQSAVTSAKNTILYAIIGIIVAFLAYGAVNFLATQLAPKAPTAA